jgi:hypothetical protein
MLLLGISIYTISSTNSYTPQLSAFEEIFLLQSFLDTMLARLNKSPLFQDSLTLDELIFGIDFLKASFSEKKSELVHSSPPLFALVSRLT